MKKNKVKYNFRKQGRSTASNNLSIGLGIVVFLSIGSWTAKQYDYDKFLPHYHHLFQLDFGCLPGKKTIACQKITRPYDECQPTVFNNVQ